MPSLRLLQFPFELCGMMHRCECTGRDALAAYRDSVVHVALSPFFVLYSGFMLFEKKLVLVAVQRSAESSVVRFWEHCSDVLLIFSL